MIETDTSQPHDPIDGGLRQNAREAALMTAPVLPGSKRVLVAIPAYNEARYRGSSTNSPPSERLNTPLVVDDGSTDGTAEIAEMAGADIIRHATNQGKTGGVRTAFARARELGVDVLVLIDGDSQHEPDDVDAVVGPVRAAKRIWLLARALSAFTASPLANRLSTCLRHGDQPALGFQSLIRKAASAPSRAVRSIRCGSAAAGFGRVGQDNSRPSSSASPLSRCQSTCITTSR